ncbi:MAG TPA: amidohydrolase family protein [Terriglobia bacterium]|nr:amidohydrolase family protein [Terriglobia bacterium]
MIRTAQSPVRSHPRLEVSDSPSLLLSGGWVALDATSTIRADLEIANGRILRLIDRGRKRTGVENADLRSRQVEISLEGCLILPGLINSHDHLEFNLFPRLGQGPYPNFGKWADDIFYPESSPIREHLSIPKRVRLWWGGIKNLLSGITTVCHHNAYEKSIFDADFPVRVVKRYGWAHSLRFGKNVEQAFLSTPRGAPFIIHLAEGSDKQSGDEIFRLDRLGALNSRTVIVHGVGLTGRGHELRRQRGAALVWCPTSNRFTLGTTLDMAGLSRRDRISLGSDSALTAEGDLLDEVRAAHREGLDPRQIYSMVTESAADVLRLRNGEGKLQPGSNADLLVVKQQNVSPAETLINTRLNTIEMVMVSGRPHMVSAKIALSFPSDFLERFEDIEVEGTSCYIRAPVGQLLKDPCACLGAVIRLAGKRVSA